MSTTWDWSPVFGQNGAVSNFLQNMAYQRQLQAMMGKEETPGAPAQQASVPMPQTQLPGQSMTANVPGNAVTQRAGYQAPQISGGPVTIGGGTLDVSAPAIAPQTSYNGPVGSVLGDQQSAALMPFLQSLGPRGLPLLMQATQNAIQHKQDIADQQITPLSDQEAQSLGLRAGGKYGRNSATGNISTIQAPDTESDAKIQQQKDLYAAENDYEPIPLTDPVYKGYRPGTILGRNKLGAVKPLQESDMMSPGALQQKEELARVEKEAAAEAQMKMYGLGGAGGAGFDATKPLSGPYETVAQAIANYGMDENSALSRYPAPVRASIQARVQGINPDYRQQDFAASKAAQIKFGSSKQGDTVRSLNVAISHLNTLGHLSDALGNGNLPVVNSIAQTFAQQTGNSAPTNFDTAKQIVGDEITKAIIGTGGSVADRDKAQAVISRANSPAQLKGAIQTYQQLLAGQLSGLRRQYQVSTKAKNFNDYLSPETISVLGNGDAPTAAPGSNPQPANVIHYDAQGNRIP